MHKAQTENSNDCSQSSFQDQQNKGRPDVLNGSKAHGVARKGLQIHYPDKVPEGEVAKTGWNLFDISIK